MTLYQQAVERGIKLYTTSEVGRELGIDIQTVRWHIKHGKLPALKHGREWYIPEPALERFRAKRDGMDTEQLYTAGDLF